MATGESTCRSGSDNNWLLTMRFYGKKKPAPDNVIEDEQDAGRHEDSKSSQAHDLK